MRVYLITLVWLYVQICYAVSKDAIDDFSINIKVERFDPGLERPCDI